ncbi:hypothetical protein [Pseudoduganella sp. RAF53_2]|uniref:hypothetical protein n=1 Tax=unclassified Pseudoduganella TaxID=2637179 RepID=UPI003F9E826C
MIAQRFAALLLLLTLSNVASASSCLRSPLREKVHEADQVFIATLVEAKLIPAELEGLGPRVDAVFRIDRVFKGLLKDTSILLKTGLDIDAVPLFVGSEYVIFKRKDSDFISTCSGSGSVYGFEKDRVITEIRFSLRQRVRKQAR